MRNSWIFKAIKEVNGLCDKLTTMEKGSPEYEELAKTIDDVYHEMIPSCKDNYTLHYSKRTGHFFVRF